MILRLQYFLGLELHMHIIEIYNWCSPASGTAAIASTHVLLLHRLVLEDEYAVQAFRACCCCCWKPMVVGIRKKKNMMELGNYIF
jgi:hypothetical protein